MLTIADAVLAHALRVLSLAKLWRIATDIEKKKSFIKRGSFKKYVRSNLPLHPPQKKKKNCENFNLRKGKKQCRQVQNCNRIDYSK